MNYLVGLLVTLILTLAFQNQRFRRDNNRLKKALGYAKFRLTYRHEIETLEKLVGEM